MGATRADHARIGCRRNPVVVSRAHWARTAIGLLQEIKDDTDSAGDPPLLAAIADGTFGLMKRPADKGRGLDGVARKARDYYNPATEILEGDA